MQKKRPEASAASNNGNDLRQRVEELERCVARLATMPFIAKELHGDKVAAAAEAERKREHERHTAAEPQRREVFEEWVARRLVFYDDLVVSIEALIFDYTKWAQQRPRQFRMTPEEVEQEVQNLGVVKKTTMPSKMGGLTRIDSLIGVRLLEPGEDAVNVIQAIEDAAERAYRQKEERHLEHVSRSNAEDAAIQARAARDRGLAKLGEQK